MNSIVLMAELLTEPELRYTTDNLAVSSMTVQFPSTRAEDEPFQVRVAAFGDLAQLVIDTCHQGDHVTIEGQLHMNTIERNGRSEKLAEITARRIYPMGTGLPETLSGSTAGGSTVSGSTDRSQGQSSDSTNSPPSTSHPTPAPAPAPTRPPEPNLDDIPF